MVPHVWPIADEHWLRYDAVCAPMQLHFRDTPNSLVRRFGLRGARMYSSIILGLMFAVAWLGSGEQLAHSIQHCIEHARQLGYLGWLDLNQRGSHIVTARVLDCL